MREFILDEGWGITHLIDIRVMRNVSNRVQKRKMGVDGRVEGRRDLHSERFTIDWGEGGNHTWAGVHRNFFGRVMPDRNPPDLQAAAQKYLDIWTLG